VVKNLYTIYGKRANARADINKRILCNDWLGNKYVMSLYVSGCLLVDGNVCRQSLGKAAAAALYTESVSQSDVQRERVSSLVVRVSRRIRIEHEAVSELLAVSLNGNNEFSQSNVFIR